MKTKPKPKRKKITTQERTVPPKKFIAVALITLSALVLLSIMDYHQEQFHGTNPEDSNWVGEFGAYVGHYGFHNIGAALWLFPFLIGFLGYRFFFEQKRGLRLRQLALAIVSLVALSGLLAIFESLELLGFASEGLSHQLTSGLGGRLGNVMVLQFLEPVLGPLGSILIFSMALTSSLYIGLGDNLGSLSRLFLSGMSYVFFGPLYTWVRWVFRGVYSVCATIIGGIKSCVDWLVNLLSNINLGKNKSHSKVRDVGDEASKADDLLDQAVKGVTSVERPKVVTPVAEKVAVEEVEVKKPPLDPAMFKIVKGEKTEKSVASIPERRGDYVFPTIDLLQNAPVSWDQASEDHVGMMEALVQTLDEFGVKVVPGEIFTGPVITRYEVTPAAGVRVEKIVNLDKNIALGLRALSVRILAPVPGKGTVGIEVPNRIAQAVCMRDIIESKSWAEANAEIPIVLGKDVTGKPMVTDLTKMPHVLIAGSTGSGKTVCINAIIASLLYHSGPEDLRFIMVDPKVVEMQLYNALPHMLIPVVTEPKKVPGALKWLIAEMDRRYQIFAKTKVRNIAGFNAKISKDKAEQERAKEMEAEMTAEERAAATQIEVPRDDDAFEVPKKKLPYIVCIIDELADLMMVAPADIETGIARIAQLARAAGIHLILATQRPSVNVITGVIKANLPSRIAFKVASKIDSRTILDGSGAEALIGKGDMLFIPPGTSNLVRAQGAFVSDDEINGIVDFLKAKNDPPVFAEAVQRQIDSSEEEGGGLLEGEEDEMLNKALEVLKSSKRASTSMLQRRLRIGYNRAARLMEDLEDRGIVGPENGSSPREILVDLDML
ncbi:MAG: DNA translocase FtsK 4TM domain-containing protein [Verrucomicrobia bacterium]|nr:DNA translocase FtsK 4TM domain-containing protein [Verrucomicrobiota bacterium]